MIDICYYYINLYLRNKRKTAHARNTILPHNIYYLNNDYNSHIIILYLVWVPFHKLFECKSQLVMVSAVVLWLAIGVFVSITLCIQEDICDLQGSLYMKRGGGKGVSGEGGWEIGVDDKKGIFMQVTWLTVVPIEPCSTICNILASGGTWFIAFTSSLLLFCMSSIATSMGFRTI